MQPRGSRSGSHRAHLKNGQLTTPVAIVVAGVIVAGAIERPPAFLAGKAESLPRCSERVREPIVFWLAALDCRDRRAAMRDVPWNRPTLDGIHQIE